MIVTPFDVEACAKFPSPSAIPTCDTRFHCPKKTASPAFRLPFETDFPIFACSAAVRGSEIPAHSYMTFLTKPEQSVPFFVEPP